VSKVEQLRVIDAEIVQHVLARGKLWEKRKKILQSIPAESEELKSYQAELQEWLEAMSNDSKGGQS
jgi:hypothetical protein